MVGTPVVKAVGGVPATLRLLENGLAQASMKAAPFLNAPVGEIKLDYQAEDLHLDNMSAEAPGPVDIGNLYFNPVLYPIFGAYVGLLYHR